MSSTQASTSNHAEADVNAVVPPVEHVTNGAKEATDVAPSGGQAKETEIAEPVK